MTPIPSCRLYFVFAREAPVGVIFRRGPTKWVQLVKWNTNTDTFEQGQWFQGRINEKSADLSPSGDKLLYSAYRYRRTTYNAEIGYAWTAVSRPPYLTALCLWPTIAAPFGGGLFDTEDHVRIWYPFNDLAPHADFQPVESFTYDNEWPAAISSDRGDGPRLDRDGWCKLQTGDGKYIGRAIRGKYALTRRWSIAGNEDSARISIQDVERGLEMPLPGVEWADWDQAGRPVFVADGKEFAGEIGRDPVEWRELADLNGNKFAAVEAPEWAMRW